MKRLRHRRPLVFVSMAATMLGASCGSASTRLSVSALPSGVRVENLAGGPLGALPTGALFLRVQGFAQAPGTSLPSSSHQPGFVCELAGTQRDVLSTGPVANIGPGQAYFQPNVAHTHTNPGDTPNAWYNLALWPSAVRGAPPVVANARVVYATDDIAASALPAGPYVETLQRLTLDPGGRTSAQRHGGLEMALVVSGTTTVHAQHRSAVNLAREQGTYVLPDVAVQFTNPSSTEAVVLAFFVTPVGRPFATDVARSP
jgi:quercetin dioxygenase-like cupin family protein